MREIMSELDDWNPFLSFLSSYLPTFLHTYLPTYLLHTYLPTYLGEDHFEPLAERDRIDTHRAVGACSVGLHDVLETEFDTQDAVQRR